MQNIESKSAPVFRLKRGGAKEARGLPQLDVGEPGVFVEGRTRTNHTRRGRGGNRRAIGREIGRKGSQ